MIAVVCISEVIRSQTITIIRSTKTQTWNQFPGLQILQRNRSNQVQVLSSPSRRRCASRRKNTSPAATAAAAAVRLMQDITSIPTACIRTWMPSVENDWKLERWLISTYSLHIDNCVHRVGQIKLSHLTFLPITSECMYRSFFCLAHVNYVKQELVW